jgi:putative ABC transport system ATP-binding protein
MRPFVIETKGVGKSYQMADCCVTALKGVNLQVPQGDFLAVMGPSGSGKSTLLHLLGCLDTPSEGEYLLDGQDVSGLDDGELSLVRASKIGFVFQSFNLIPQLTVFENIEVPFLYQEVEQVGLRLTILRALERVGLSHRIHHLPSQLSGGETQRVAIARALAVNPLIILADEPTGNLDSVTGNAILELFEDLNQHGVTMILITHDEQVASRCRRTVRMRDGEIISDRVIE